MLLEVYIRYCFVKSIIFCFINYVYRKRFIKEIWWVEKLIRDKWLRKIDWEGGNKRDNFERFYIDMDVCMMFLFLFI